MASGKSRSNDGVETLWERIGSWLKKHWPEARLAPGASNAQIDKAEAALGLRLPKDVRRSYRVHDGSPSVTLIPLGPWRVTFSLLPLSGVIAHGKTIQRALEKG